MCVELLIPITCLTCKLNSIFFCPALTSNVLHSQTVLCDCPSVFHSPHTLISRNRIVLFMHKSILLLFLFFILCLLFNVCSFHLSSPPPSLSKSLDVYNETIINSTNYKIKISFSNILHICVFILGIIILLWFSYFYTVCNHVRYVCFTTNLSLLSAIMSDMFVLLLT